VRLTLAVALLFAVANAPQRSLQPFVPIGVWYDTSGSSQVTVLRDLQTIRSLGFNHIKIAAS
jgi:hypothetical protein